MATTSPNGYIGQSLVEIPAPAVVLDLGVLETNCQRMLDAIDTLDLGWRCHIKTHKTIEATRLQVGSDPHRPANIIVSTVLEAENIIPLLQEYESQGRAYNVLYGFPIHSSSLDRLATLARTLGQGSLSLLLDHPKQIDYLQQIKQRAGWPPGVFIKVDMGYKRAGAVPGSATYCELIDSVLRAQNDGFCKLEGLYSHTSQSYGTDGQEAAMGWLVAEFRALFVAAADVRKSPEYTASTQGALHLSVGASPQVTAIQDSQLLHPRDTAAADNGRSSAQAKLTTLLEQIKAAGCTPEVHAGVYPFLDLQQIATRSRSTLHANASSIAISVLAEVVSLYPGRGDGGTTEALISAGSLALGREPCKDYEGWGIVTPWNSSDDDGDVGIDDAAFPASHRGWQVGRISQEHGVLVWKGKREDEMELSIGQKVRVWPNHACIAGAGFGEYLVVDSRRKGEVDVVQQVWKRCNGW